MSCKILQHGVHRLDIYRLIFFVRNGHETGYAYSGNKNFCHYTVNSRFKKDLKLQIHLLTFFLTGFYIHYINIS